MVQEKEPLEKIEKTSRRTAFIVSLVVHVLIVTLFFFIYAWEPPIPPPPEYGIELSYGSDEEGQGENPRFVPTQERQSEDLPEESTAPNEVVETPSQLPEAEVSVPQKAPETKPQLPKDQPKQAEPEPQPNPKALFNPEGSGTGKGDDGKEGIKGRSEGTLDGRGLYGGGEGGFSLTGLDGWKLSCNNLQVNDNSGEEGFITFEIIVDEDGYLQTITTKQYNVSPRVVALYKRALEEQIEGCLVRSSARVPSRARGTITFRLKSK